MSVSDHYRTIAAPVEFRQKIERSEFLGIAFPVLSEPSFLGELAAVQKRYFDATHHCWAFRLRERARSSDAGEPSGTAGKPILNAIESADLSEVGVVVVRWYGGIKLGTGGLSRAYRETAASALQLAARVDRYLYTRFEVTVPFDAFGTIYRLADPPHVILAEERFGETNTFTFDVRTSRAEAFAKALTERRLLFET
ncbi:MAG TPA: YigZ family protein [Thermoanaerobaculia bacterium]